jgi:nucleoside-diphosphate-sugar epimerase
MTKVLITGATGFAGHYFATAFAEAGFEVHGLAKDDSTGSVPALHELHHADLNDLDELERIIAHVKPNKVVHLAAIAFVAHGCVEEIYRSNLLGTRNLLQALVRQGDDCCNTVLLMSSANVYGNRSSGAIREDCLPDPINDYALSKLAMEYLVHIFRDRLPFIVVRPFNYTGVGQSNIFVIPKIVEHARARIKRIELGNLDVARDFSDVRFVTNACLKLIQTPEALGQTVNICSGKGYKLKDIISLVEKICGHAFEIEIHPDLIRTNEISQLWGDRTKLNALIGDVKNPSIEETLTWMLYA